ncbi:unnamed protein product [Leptidea sinapis]|uniref:Uncharacterized protein n=1 Tax=Leptidea sinapis TaxID=189913 RepID=A0A5E4QN18_9NEOP|nr:unnamed protein product [Leptidea sinapis]
MTEHWLRSYELASVKLNNLTLYLVIADQRSSVVEVVYTSAPVLRHNFSQLVDFPTRLEGNTGSLLDHVYSNLPEECVASVSGVVTATTTLSA